MEASEHNLREAESYLERNTALRRALGIDDDTVCALRYLGEGEHNLNYRFDNPADSRSYVLRVNVVPQPFHDNQVEYEYAALKLLEPSGCVPVPAYVDSSPSAPENGVLVIEFCEGDELDFDHLRPGDLRCAAQLMANVHAVSPAGNDSIHKPVDPLRELYEECLERFELYRASGFEDARITSWVETFVKAAKPALQTRCYAADCAHVVNTETLPSHFLIPRQSADAAASAQASGPFCQHPGSFVDWERPIIGEVAQDVAYFVSPTTTFWDSDYLFPACDVDQFVEDYWRAVDGRFERGNFDERFRAFRMMTVLRSVTWCCKALARYGSTTESHTTAKTAAKLPVYLSDDFMELLAEECFGL